MFSFIKTATQRIARRRLFGHQVQTTNASSQFQQSNIKPRFNIEMLVFIHYWVVLLYTSIAPKINQQVFTFA